MQNSVKYWLTKSNKTSERSLTLIRWDLPWYVGKVQHSKFINAIHNINKLIISTDTEKALGKNITPFILKNLK